MSHFGVPDGIDLLFVVGGGQRAEEEGAAEGSGGRVDPTQVHEAKEGDSSHSSATATSIAN